MPRYFFHLDEDEDDGGTELPHDAAAHQAAAETFGQMIHDGAAKADSQMQVVDAAGRRVVTLKYSAES